MTFRCPENKRLNNQFRLILDDFISPSQICQIVFGHNKKLQVTQTVICSPDGNVEPNNVQYYILWKPPCFGKPNVFLKQSKRIDYKWLIRLIGNSSEIVLRFGLNCGCGARQQSDEEFSSRLSLGLKARNLNCLHVHLLSGQTERHLRRDQGHYAPGHTPKQRHPIADGRFCCRRQRQVCDRDHRRRSRDDRQRPDLGTKATHLQTLPVRLSVVERAAA